jgi:hypothetical protein|tara:strand:- start:1796 stop:2089 length:294 start_codon:yes stop_codon:yes gene_type:complete
MLDTDKMIEAGMVKIVAIQALFDKKIENAPVKSGYDKWTGGYTTSQRDYRKAKYNAIKDVCENLAVFGVTLLSQDNLDKLRPDEGNLVDEVRERLGG